MLIIILIVDVIVLLNMGTTMLIVDIIIILNMGTIMLITILNVDIIVILILNPPLSLRIVQSSPPRETSISI